MQLTATEIALFCAITDDLVLDLVDRGLFLSSESTTLLEIVRSPGSQGVEDLFLRSLPCMGRALDALLLTDGSTDRTTHQCALETFWVSAVPILGIELCNRLIWMDPIWEPNIIRALRELSYLFYKYDVPPTKIQVLEAVDKFVSTDKSIEDLRVDVSRDLALLSRIFRGIDLSDITPRHGPGAVSMKEIGPEKYDWSNMPQRLVNVYSYDYFVASYAHLCEVLSELRALPESEPSARLLTVPKDSRGPRVISCEPKEFQWIQQGIMSKLVAWIEHHPITRNHVRFTDQGVNGRLALTGSKNGDWATLDLSEASDRVSLEYVEKSFPEWVTTYILACRSLSTRLPSGELVVMKKFAPMGSANCFPILALTVFTRLRVAGITQCHVYGDDVIVPKAQALLAIKTLEEIGLKVNTSKSCMTGFFRESCGVDAYRGVNVTPMRIKHRWSSRPHPSAYVAWCSYANQLYVRGYIRAAMKIAVELGRIYGPIPQSKSEVR